MTATASAGRPAGTARSSTSIRPAGSARGPRPGSGSWSRARRTAAAATVAVAPASLLAAIIYHPFIADLRHKHDVAAALTAGATRWSLAHVAAAVASALIALAFLAVAAALRQRGEWRWSARAVPFVVVGSTLFAMLPAMEIAVLAASLAGADAEAVLLEMDAWFRPLLVAGAAVFAVGMACAARSVVAARVLGRPTTALVVVALTVAALSRFLPFGAALIVGAAALVVGLWPLVGIVAARPSAPRAAG
jgi:hypothetical protein